MGGGPGGGVPGGVPGRGPGGGAPGGGPSRGPEKGVPGGGLGARHAWRAQQTAPTVAHGRRPDPLSVSKGPPRVGGSPSLLTTLTPEEDSVDLAELCSWIQSYIVCVMKGTPCNDPCCANALCEAVHYHIFSTEAETAQF